MKNFLSPQNRVLMLGAKGRLNAYHFPYSLPFLFLCLALSSCMLNTDRAVAPSPEQQWVPNESALEKVETKPSETVETPPSVLTPKTETESGPLDLAQLMNEGLKNNPSTQKAWYSAKAVAARKIEANSTFFPKVTASENLQKQRIDAIAFPGIPGGFGVPPTNIITTRETYGPIIGVSYTLFRFGADAASADAAAEALNAANFQFNRTLQSVVLQVQKSYFALNAAEEAVKAGETNLKDAKESFDAAKARSDAGLNPIQDVLKAESNYLEAKYVLDSSRSLVEAARANLAQAIGRKDIASIEIRPPAPPEAPPQLLENIKDLVNRALEARPDIQAAYAGLRSSQASKRAAERSLLPSLVTEVSGDHTRVRSYPGTEYNYTAYLNLRWNIFDGFNKESKVLEARAESEAAKRDAHSLELRAVSEVWTHFHNVESSKEKLESARAFLKASEASFAAIEIGYKNGLNNVLDMLSAQRDLASARLMVVNSEMDLSSSLADLGFALGEIPSEILTKGK